MLSILADMALVATRMSPEARNMTDNRRESVVCQRKRSGPDGNVVRTKRRVFSFRSFRTM